MRKLFFLLLATVLLGACSSIDCPLENTVSLSVGFYKANGLPDTLRIDTLTVSTTRRDGNDTVLINRDVKATGIQLPLSSGAVADTFLISLKDTLNREYLNRIIISKTDQPHFESVDCKMSYFHTITNVDWSGSRIDSISITKQQVDYDASSQHLHIYFKALP